MRKRLRFAPGGTRMRLLAAALAACTALAASPLPLGCSAESRIERHRERAEEFAAKGELQAAALELQAALLLRPGDADLSLRLAELHATGGDPKQALFFFEEAHRLAPERSDAALALAAALVATDPARAEGLAKEVLAREPERADALALVSEVALANGDAAAAESIANRALEVAPGDPGAHLARGRARFAALVGRVRDGEAMAEAPLEAALADLDAAIAGGTGATRLRARAVRARLFAVWPGRGADAERAFRERAEQAFVEAGPAEQLEAARAAGRYATRTGNAALLRFSLEKGVLADPTSEAAWRALVLAEERAGGSADPILERLRTARPGDPAAARLHALLLVDRGRIDEAIAELQEAVAEHPDEPDLLEMLAHVLFDHGRNAEGAAAIERLQRDYPEAPATRRALAREALRNGSPAKAIPMLEDPSGASATLDGQLLLAAAYFQTGRIEEASAAIERAKEIGGSGAPRVLQLELRIDQGAARWSEVLRDHRELRALGIAPRPAELTAVAEALYETGRPIPARKLLEGLLASPDPPVGAVLEFVRREGAADPERTAKILDAALARTPGDVRLIMAAAAAQAARGDVDGALGRLDAAAGPLAPTAAIAVERARILAAAKRNEQAKVELLVLLERAPDFGPALDLLVEVWRSEGALERELAALSAQEERGELAPGRRVLVARVARARGDRARARAELERVVTELPDLAGAKRDLAVLLLEEGGDPARARELAEAARAALPGDAVAARALGTALLRSGDAGRALAALEAARGLARGNPDAERETRRGAALEALGRKKAARAAYAAALRADPANAEARAALERLAPIP